MKKTTIRAPEGKPDTDKIRRVYRASLDIIKRLDEAIKQQKAYRDVFMPGAICLRARLQEYCEKLMFTEPIDFGRKAEELLWRKVFYDVIQLLKHHKKQMRPNSSLESAYRTHLYAATGYYHHLLFRLQHYFNLRLQGILDFHHIPEPKSHKNHRLLKKQDFDCKIRDWAIRACHRCLIYLGDLARYQQEYDSVRSRMLAQRYYYQALSLCPEIGMPYNQLGTLAGSRYYNVDAAYYYLRCLVSPNTFEGAQGNLQRLFEKNTKRYQEIQSSPRDLPPDLQRSKDIKRFLVRFMHLLQLFHGIDQNTEAKDLQECCQLTLQDLDLCLFYQPPQQKSPNQLSGSDERLPYLEDSLVFKIVIMCMATVCRLQDIGSKTVTAAIAFSLALFSHILNHVVIHLQSALYEAENPRKVIQLDDSEGTDEREERKKVENTDTQNNKSDHQTTNIKKEKRKSKLKLLRRRRRRRGSHASSSGSELSGGSGSDLSDGVEDVESDMSSENEETSYLNHDLSSSSDSNDEEDALMVSQELRQGFAVCDTSNVWSNEENIIDPLTMSAYGSSSQSGLNSNAAINQAMFGELTSLSEKPQNMDILPDMSEYLKDFSMELFSANSAKFLNHALGLAQNGAEQREEDEDVCSAVIKGTRAVSVPPGFDRDPEAMHVAEITEKMANYVIETDTDTSVFPTDTENSSIPTESDQDLDDQSSTDSVIDRTEAENSHTNHLVGVIAEEGLLASIKVFCDWMMCHQTVITTCAQSSASLWTRLSYLLNFLPLESDLAKTDFCQSDAVLELVEKYAAHAPTLGQPLPEDLTLRQFTPLREAHLNLEFDCHKRLTLSKQQEAIFRICWLRSFAYGFAKMEGINFWYDTERKIFCGPLHSETKQDEKEVQEKMADAEVRRNQLMRDMAQLRLQAEVNQLEGSLKSSGQPHLPPYLVPDTAALAENLHLVKQLTNSARFIIIVPLVVIDHLDELKKERVGARDAIRWLEAEFRKGNRYMRAQKQHEKTNSGIQKNMRKKDPEAWRFFQLVDCCKYLAQQSNEYDAQNMACILTGRNMKSEESVRVQLALSTAQQEGLTVRNVQDFHSKWKETWKHKS